MRKEIRFRKIENSGRKFELLIETDILLSIIKSDDPLRKYATRVFELSNLRLSPYSLIELSFLERSGKLEIEDPLAFSSALAELVTSNEVQLIADKPSYHHHAIALERDFRLTFFDSLHASVAKVEGEALASFDSAYDRAERSGVKRVDPRKL